LIEHGPASGVAPQSHQAFPCSGALVSLLGNRWYQRTLIILGAAKRCLPDCRDRLDVKQVPHGFHCGVPLGGACVGSPRCSPFLFAVCQGRSAGERRQFETNSNPNHLRWMQW
jgi:hypothetical protein